MVNVLSQGMHAVNTSKGQLPLTACLVVVVKSSKYSSVSVIISHAMHGGTCHARLHSTEGGLLTLSLISFYIFVALACPLDTLCSQADVRASVPFCKGSY